MQNYGRARDTRFGGNRFTGDDQHAVRTQSFREGLNDIGGCYFADGLLSAGPKARRFHTPADDASCPVIQPSSGENRASRSTSPVISAKMKLTESPPISTPVPLSTTPKIRHVRGRSRSPA